MPAHPKSRGATLIPFHVFRITFSQILRFGAVHGSDVTRATFCEDGGNSGAMSMMNWVHIDPIGSCHDTCY